MNTQRASKDVKTDLIIQVAQKRFGLFGVEKTSMREIAGDLKISKGLLYYYFPDKENLYKAVIEKEQAEFEKNFEAEICEISDPAECLRKYVQTRLSYFRKLLNLGRLSPESLSEMRPVMVKLIENFRETEKKEIVEILEKGNKIKLFNIENISDSATLFLDLLRGLRTNILREKKVLFIEEEEYSDLSRKAIAFTELFIRGLKCK
jgi:AcrR family transcriptional regulator